MESEVSDRSQVTGSSRSRETEEQDGYDLPQTEEELDDGLEEEEEDELDS